MPPMTRITQISLVLMLGFGLTTPASLNAAELRASGAKACITPALDTLMNGGVTAGRARHIHDDLFVLSVRHADGRPLALLANYSLRYGGDVGPGHVSADYFGVFADRIQQLLGADRQDPPFIGILCNGTSGDIDTCGYIPAPEQLPLGAYETWRMRTIPLETNAIPKMTGTFLGMLERP
jgi:hypothetical protein